MVSLIQAIQHQPREYPKFCWKDGVLTRKGKIVAGSVLRTRKIILDWLHASPVGGHSGIRATKKRIKAMFY